MNLNRVTLIGRLARDPELRITTSDRSVADFTLAVDKRVKPTDPDAATADFFRCKAWNQQADFLATYAAKGRLVSVDGRLETRRFVDKDGQNREVVEIVADSVSLLDRPREPEAATPPPAAPVERKGTRVPAMAGR